MGVLVRDEHRARRPAPRSEIADPWDNLKREIGISGEHQLVVVKQYGDYRTGTNALRALLLENFDNALVLMHVLGDKHARPVDLDEAGRLFSRPGAEPGRVLLQLTRSVPGGYSLTDSFYQLAFVRLVAPQVAAALLGDSLCVTVSVRHPYAWLEAVLRFWNWPEAPHGDAWVASERAALAKRLCIRFNQRYASWLGFAANFGGRALVVRAEDLREQPEQVAARAGTTFGLHPRRNRIVGLRRNVLPSPWDHFPPCYERRRARTGPRRKSLSPELMAIAAEAIDWPMLAGLGYARSGGIGELSGAVK